MKRWYTYSLLGVLLLYIASASPALADDKPEYSGFLGAIGAVTGSNLYVGQVGVEAEFLDAQSNERLAAVASKQAGKKYVPFTDKKFDPASTWGQVEQGMDYWAKKLRKRVDALHGKTVAASGS
jgi:hypothetical protein